MHKMADGPIGYSLRLVEFGLIDLAEVVSASQDKRGSCILFIMTFYNLVQNKGEFDTTDSNNGFEKFGGICFSLVSR